MENLTIKNLINTFNTAIDVGSNFVGVKITMEGFDKDEVIINEYDNFETKLDYYQKTYDDNLFHKFAKGIKISGFTFGQSFDDIQYDLVGER